MGALLGLAVLTFGGVSTRRAQLIRRAHGQADAAVPSGVRLRARLPAPSSSSGLAPGRQLWRSRIAKGGPSGARPDIGLLVTEVATRLRAGADVDTAWTAAFARTTAHPADGPVMDAHGVPRPLLALRSGHAAGARPSAIAACRLTHELGAPLAETLEQCAYGIAEAEQAHSSRDIALAGPRSTARLLGWLPMAALLLGVVAGADPLRVLLDGALGTACLLLGTALLVLGHGWTARLIRAAVRDSD